MLDHYTHHGYRVIALASKCLPQMTSKRSRRLKRPDAESDLVFLGFIVFENKLKPSTAGVLKQLRDARIRQIMCTGDNILTAISVARECELVSKESYVFVPRFGEGIADDDSADLGDSTLQDSMLEWTCVQDSRLTLNPYSLVPHPIPQDALPDFPFHNTYGIMDYSLAVSGDVFRWIIDFAPPNILERVSLARVVLR